MIAWHRRILSPSTRSPATLPIKMIANQKRKFPLALAAHDDAARARDAFRGGRPDLGLASGSFSCN